MLAVVVTKAEEEWFRGLEPAVPWHIRPAAWLEIGALSASLSGLSALGHSPWLVAGLAAAWGAVACWRADRRGQHAGLRAARAMKEAAAAEASKWARCAAEAAAAHAALEGLQEGVFVLGKNGCVLLANAAARQSLAEVGRDPVGHTLWELLPRELGAAARGLCQSLDHRRDGDRVGAARSATVASQHTILDLVAIPVSLSRSGADSGVVLLLQPGARGHELRRLKDRFLSSISHELRTPLTNICAYAEILRNLLPGESAEWPEFVRVVHEQGLHLSRLVDGMFEYLQMESGEAPFRDDVVDAVAIVQAVVGELDTVARSSEVALAVAAVDAAAPPPAVRGDGKRLAQVVRKLLDNALKFTPRGGRIVVSVARRSDAFELRVEDSGPGVPPHARQSVFETFHQLADPLTEKVAGTGLGLATCRAIVTRLGGLIWCEESLLGGAAFVVSLPGVGQPRLAVACAPLPV